MGRRQERQNGSAEQGDHNCMRQGPRYRISRFANRRGIVMIWTAIFLLVLIGIVGLSLDWGKTAVNIHQLYNAADAAALAGAQVVKVDQDRAIRFAVTAAKQNFVDHNDVDLDYVRRRQPFANDMDIVLVRYYRQKAYNDPTRYEPNLSLPNGVKVTARRRTADPSADPNYSTDSDLPLVFGPAFKKKTVGASRYAIAICVGAARAGLLTLLEYPPGKMGIHAPGTADIRVIGGEIQDNSQSVDNPRQAFRGSGDFSLYCEELHVCGEIYPPLDDPYWDTVGYPVNANIRVPLPDPLVKVPDMWSDPPQGARPAVIAPPPPDTAYPGPIPMATYYYGLYGMAVEVSTTTGVPVLDSNGKYISRGFDASLADPITGSTIATYGQNVNGVQTLTLVPGYYPGGFKLSQGNKIKLLPGVYAFGGGRKNGDNSGVVMTGGILEGLGVMLYVTDSNQRRDYWGRVSLDGGELNLTEGLDRANPEAEPYPDYVGTNYKYIAIFQDRANPNEAKLSGNVVFTQLKGTLYFPTAHMAFSGTGIEAGTQLIAGSIETVGTTSLTVNYDGRFHVPTYRSMLIE
jgi:Flp pilus assembly protein TadG